MKYFKKENLGKSITLISFLLGTVLIGLYYFTVRQEFLLIGYILVTLLVIINIAVFIASLVEAIKNKPLRKKLLTNSALMLINIPVAYFYLWVIISLFSSTPSS